MGDSKPGSEPSGSSISASTNFRQEIRAENVFSIEEPDLPLSQDVCSLSHCDHLQTEAVQNEYPGFKHDPEFELIFARNRRIPSRKSPSKTLVHQCNGVVCAGCGKF